MQNMTKKYFLNTLFFVTLLIWCFALAYPIQPDYDIWARLIAGKSVVENCVILKQDFLSYTPTNIWYDHEWLSGTVFYLLTKIASFFKISELQMFSAFKSVMTFLIFLFAAICVYIKKPENAYPFQILYFSVAVLAANVVFAPTVRCHLFSFLFFSVWLFILELYRINNNKKLLVLLPISMILWSNMHGGCLSGLGLLFIYILGELFNGRNIKPYIATLLVSLLVLFINPYGIGYVKYLFFAGTMDRSWISEWASPFSIPNQTFKFLVYFIFMGCIALIQPLIININYKNIDKTKLLLLIITAIISIMHTKLLPFFVISSTIFMFEEVNRVFNRVSVLKNIINYKNMYIYGCIVLLAISVIKTNYKSVFTNYQMYPYKAVQFIKDNKLSGNLFTEFSYGSYCIYKLYPQNKIFMDGRYEEVYPDYLFTEMKNFIRQDGNNANSVLTNYPTDIVLLYNFSKSDDEILNDSNSKTKVFKALRDMNWHRVYKDEYFEVYVRPDYSLNNFDKFEFKPLIFLQNMFDTDITKEILLDASKR